MHVVAVGGSPGDRVGESVSHSSLSTKLCQVKALVMANATLEAQDVGERTPLQLAVHQDHTETIKVLEEAEARRERAHLARLAHALRKAGRAPQGQFCSTSTPQSCFVR